MRKACLTAISVALLVGCSTDITGDAIADSPTDQTFDPCTIPDSTITAAGLDPASKDSMADKGYTTPGWTICGWEGPAGDPWYSFTVYFSETHTLEDVRGNPQNSDFSDVSIAGRTAVVYKVDIVDESDTCDVAFDTASGVATFTVLTLEAGIARSDVCDIAENHVRDVAMAFPAN
ncbi:DUF3558 domain-containing protein [Rhodococcus sp. 14-2470-1a]|uniref:DUF3558 domain-containing protein n=1 Tax=Rhodococcus sp. 14-2470-1a TaxID=2023150 RepID=UPI000B9B6BAC|nr:MULTISPECIES: DUF3558 domain-containing protein [unclassified Rhodococcus (in: high G+C Gram-positive bacteria)]OZC55421.1 hypothetical protein CH267_12580 [Rhodococcus sp. 06-621-2]OZF56536.1 hypothetical protein CH292_02570 [Rhodococcus sp. 14-2470-1a]